MIKFRHKGDFKRLTKFLTKAGKFDSKRVLEQFGERGVIALSEATPKDSGKTAASWNYNITAQGKNSYTITWTNSNVNKTVNIAVILEYGHGTRNGGYVKGRNYIKPAIRPIFDEIAEAAWKEVTE
jgi:hypothetical protein